MGLIRVKKIEGVVLLLDRKQRLSGRDLSSWLLWADNLDQQGVPAIEVQPVGDGVESDEQPDSSSELVADLYPGFTDLITDAVACEVKRVEGRNGFDRPCFP